VVSGTGGVSLVCWDLAGIVIDGYVVERAFAEAIGAQGIVAGTQSYTRAMVKFDRARGRPPADVMSELFTSNEALATVASLAFDRSFRAAADRFGVAAPPEFVDAVGKVSEAGIRVCLLTSLTKSACAPLLDRLQLQGLAAHGALTADDAPRAFPWPDLVLTAMRNHGVSDARQVAVVSATESGLQSARQAGAGMVVGVARGPRRAAALRQSGATHLIDSIDAFLDLV
jgi:phosphoglycolate phosphatase-like HAD superfamily hydrolase